MTTSSARRRPRTRRPNPPGWTTTVGLGSQHKRDRRTALLNLRDGIDCCPYCGRPMTRRQALDLDDYPPRIIADMLRITPAKRLAHRSCNRRAGQRLGAALRRKGIRRARVAVRREW